LIDKANTALMDWARSVVGDIPVLVGPPSAGAEIERVHIHLLDLLPAPLRSTSRPAAIQARLRYLVCVTGPVPSECYGRLGTLLASAAMRDDVEVELAAIPLGVWQSFGLPPGPGFFVWQDLRIERRAAAAPPVQSPPRIAVEASLPLLGRVLSAEDRPVPDLRIAIPELGFVARTDARGEFRLRFVPQGERPLTVSITTPTQCLETELPASQISGAPLVLRLGEMEVVPCRTT